MSTWMVSPVLFFTYRWNCSKRTIPSFIHEKKKTFSQLEGAIGAMRCGGGPPRPRKALQELHVFPIISLLLLFIFCRGSEAKSASFEGWTPVRDPFNRDLRGLRSVWEERAFQTVQNKTEWLKISMADSQQHFAVCGSARNGGKNTDNGVVLLHRVLMYPLQYPHWPYLLYGRLHAREAILAAMNSNRSGSINPGGEVSAFSAVEIVGCALSGDQRQLVVAVDVSLDGPESSSVERRLFSFARRVVSNDMLSAASRDGSGAFSFQIFSESANKLHRVAPFFDMVHPRDGYGDVWVLDSSFGEKPADAVVREAGEADPDASGPKPAWLLSEPLVSPATGTSKSCPNPPRGGNAASISPSGNVVFLVHATRVLVHGADSGGETFQREVDFGQCVVETAFFSDSVLLVLLEDGSVSAVSVRDSAVAAMPIMIRGAAAGVKFRSIAATPRKACHREQDTMVPAAIAAFVDAAVDPASGQSPVYIMADNSFAGSVSSPSTAEGEDLSLVSVQVAVTSSPVLTATLSPDAETLALTLADDGGTELWTRVKDKMFRAAPVRYAKSAVLSGASRDAVAMFHFERFYVARSETHDDRLDFSLWVGPGNMTSPSCDPLGRLKSFYLPPAQLEARKDASAFSPEHDGIWRLTEPWLWLGVMVFLGLALLPVRTLERGLVRTFPGVFSFLSNDRWFSSFVVFAVACGILCFSVFEIMHQPGEAVYFGHSVILFYPADLLM
jgi:hypothetical protein